MEPIPTPLEDLQARVRRLEAFWLDENTRIKEEQLRHQWREADEQWREADKWGWPQVGGGPALRRPPDD